MSAYDQSGHWPRQSRVTGSWEIDGGLASLRLDVEGPDEFAPLLRFVGDELAKVSGRAWKHAASQIGKPRFELGIGEGRVDLFVELFDDVGGRVPGSTDAEPRADFIARQVFGYGRDVRQQVQARRRCHRQRT